MRGQQVKYIKVRDLVLWTENPRDPIDETAKDQDIVDKAFGSSAVQWSLEKLAKEMGPYYDFSELPTVVNHKGKYVVYDGNRRIVLAKIKLGLVKVADENDIDLPDFPIEIPCNVCTKEIAIENVYRKHHNSGSWRPLERDIFLHKHKNANKSVFLILDEHTGIITSNSFLNHRFVKDEIFNEESLKKLGFEVRDNILNTIHTKLESQKILSDISSKVKDKSITTRVKRGLVFEVLNSESKELIEKNKNNKSKPLNINLNVELTHGEKKKRITKRTKGDELELFGERLYLKPGNVSNLYRDVCDLYEFYIKNKGTLSISFPSIIRMALRLLCETASGPNEIDSYVRKHFKNAKKMLNQDDKTTLSNYNINENSIIQLLHTGAHAYTASKDINKTIAMSIILAQILILSHGKS